VVWSLHRYVLASIQCFCLYCFLSPASTDSPHPVLLLQGNQFIDYQVLSVISSSVSFSDLVVAAVIGGVPRLFLCMLYFFNIN